MFVIGIIDFFTDTLMCKTHMIIKDWTMYISVLSDMLWYHLVHINLHVRNLAEIKPDTRSTVLNSTST